MIKTNDNKEIMIYRKINKDLLKTALILLLIALLISFTMLFYYRSLILLHIALLPAICLIIAYRIYKQPDKEKLVFSLTKEGFTIFSKSNKFFSLNSIINFISINDNSNYACINYYDENKNKKSKMFLVYGCSNNEFVNLANSYLKEHLSNTISTESKIDANNYEFLDKTEQLYEEIELNSIPSRFTLIGKSTMFIDNGSSYNMQNIHTDMIFINEKCELLEIPLKILVIDWEDLIIDGVYEISYNKNKRKFYASRIPNEKGVDQTIIDSLKNNIVFRAKFLFDKQMIINEIKTYNRIIKLSKILGIITLLLLLLLSILINYKEKIYTLTNFDTNCLFNPIMISIVLLLFFVLPLNIVITISKLKRENNLNKKKE